MEWWLCTLEATEVRKKKAKAIISATQQLLLNADGWAWEMAKIRRITVQFLLAPSAIRMVINGEDVTFFFVFGHAQGR